MPEQHTVSWTAPEYLHEHKHPDWFWALGIIALAGAVASIVFSDILFAVLILIAAATVALVAARPPEELEVTLGTRGISVGPSFYPYQTIESFWVSTRAGSAPHLVVKSKRFFAPYLIAPLTGVDPEEVHAFLMERLPEEEHEEPIIQRLMELFGF